MKAILEFEAPESCAKCYFVGTDECNNSICDLTDGKHIKHNDWDYEIERAPFCPLKIEKDGENE